MDIVALFCDLDDFYQTFAPAWQQHWLSAPGRHRRRSSRSSPSEIMTLVIAFHDSDCRTFKHFYCKEVCRHWRAEFPALVSYQRLIECLPAVLVPLAAYLHTRLGHTRGIAFIDSLPQSPHLSSSGVCWFGPTGQEQHGLVLWLQAALYHQR